MTVPLMRDALRPLYARVAEDPPAAEPHPGLLLQRGLAEHRGDGDHESKALHVARVCRSTAGDFYRRAYARWERATTDPMRFRSVTLNVETRLFIGLTGGGMLETGCVIGHSHGMPSIPGSSIKGVVRAHALERLDTADGRAARDELFGTPAGANRPDGLSGLMVFHDAWWVPGSAAFPLVPEVVTTHHPDYYGQDGSAPATDFDSPVPNAQIAVRGAFRFVVEGPAGWLPLTEEILTSAMSTRGAGARTRAGYGRFSAKPVPTAERRCEWVDATITKLMATHHAQEDPILRGKMLAEAWNALEDPEIKEAAFHDIRARWQERGWWKEIPRGRSAQQARAIYDSWPAARDETS